MNVRQPSERMDSHHSINLFDSIDNVSKKLILELPTEIPIHIIIKANKTLIITLCLFFIMFWIYSLSHLF